MRIQSYMVMFSIWVNYLDLRHTCGCITPNVKLPTAQLADKGGLPVGFWRDFLKY